MKKVLQVWGSAYTYRAVLYRHNHNMSAEDVAIGVAVLQLVDAKFSGVLMTANPTSGNTAEMVMESNWGLGESVVSGVTNPDRFNVGKEDLAITRVINKKLKMVVPAGVGTEVIDVPVEWQEVPSLTDDEVKQLAIDGPRIEKHFGEPMDVDGHTLPENPFPRTCIFCRQDP
jgi:phosphoenolpyruvate synthase/pyruvate phosphate dikinase